MYVTDEHEIDVIYSPCFQIKLVGSEVMKSCPQHLLHRL